MVKKSPKAQAIVKSTANIEDDLDWQNLLPNLVQTSAVKLSTAFA